MSVYPKLQLTYFNTIGRAEAIRLAFFIGRIPFEDKRITFQEFQAIKDKLPNGQLPILQVDDEICIQSQALLRYAGKLGNMYPTNDPLKAFQVDEIIGALEELSDEISFIQNIKDAEKQQEMCNDLVKVGFPRLLLGIERCLQAILPPINNETIHIHELCIYVWEQKFQAGVMSIPSNITNTYPLWGKVVEKIKTNSKVQEWNVIRHHTSPFYDLHIKLTYLPFTGRAEPIRLALFMSDIPFQDERISREELNQRRGTLPFGQLPVLEINGQILSQSTSILRYAGALCGTLYPITDLKKALRIDELLSSIDELYAPYGSSCRIKDPIKQLEIRTTIGTVSIPKCLDALNKRVGKWLQPYATGETLTIADLAIYSLISGLQSGRMVGVSKDITKPYTHLLNIYERIYNHPKVLKWYETHDR